MKDRKYTIGRNGVTVWTPFSTATVGWKPLAILTVAFVLLSAVFVFAAVMAIKALVFVAVLALAVYLWFRIRRFGRDLPGAGASVARPTPPPTRVGGGEQEFPES